MNASSIRSDETGPDVQHHTFIVENPNNDNNDDDDEEESFTILNELENDRDENTILLLKQIFPNESAESLWQLHLNRCTLATTNNDDSATASVTQRSMTIPSSSLVDDLSVAPTSEEDTQERSMRQRNNHGDNIGNPNIVIPDNYLRIPQDVAIRRLVNGRWQTEFVDELGQRALKQHERFYGKVSPQKHAFYSKVIHRDNTGGLGMTLVSDEHDVSAKLQLIRVHALSGESGSDGPARQAGISENDMLIGIDGTSFIETIKQSEILLKHVVSTLRSGSDPVVLHILREIIPSTTNQSNETQKDIVSTHGTITSSNVYSDDELSLAPLIRDMSLQSDLSCSQAVSVELLDNVDSHLTSKNVIHPFVQVMANSNILTSSEDQQYATKILNDFDTRANQWNDLAAYFDLTNETLIPLDGVRKALSVRIVNIFDDKDETAYTVWVYDVESGKEWYAPVRYHRDFEDLRSAILPMCTASIQKLTFPRARGSTLNLFRPSPKKVESNIQRETKCRQLELFLRSLCSMVYKEKLHPYIAEVAIHIQSFLGCDAHEELKTKPHSFPKFVDLGISQVTCNESRSNEEEKRHQLEARSLLKRSLQCYVYRIFLLDGMSQLVERFVDRLRTHGPRLQDIEHLEGQGKDVLKARAMADLRQIQSFLDKIQDMILEGCMDDFLRISSRAEYATIHNLIESNHKDGSTYWEMLVRESVREQVEVEVYVPLRSVVSRWLVNAWRHEDMEVFFRMKELRRRPADFFRMKNSNIQQYDTTTATTILNEGVGLSTLPCMKLRAIVATAREIYRMLQISNDNEVSEENVTERALGADDFLPIFIYCIVHAELERPCALCVLLHTLCDPLHRIGEIGYYLLSFEAAIKHCEEVDLTES